MFQQPISVRAALDLMAQPGARLLAGGTDFFPALGENAVTAPLIDISRLADLRGISTDDQHIRIGAATTWSEIVRHPLPRCFDALKQAAREIGSLQIQNRATIGGNLCNASPAADSVPPLLTLDALVELASRDGTRQLPLSSFILGNRRTALQDGELVSAILIPRDVSDFTSLFAKLGARLSRDPYLAHPGERLKQQLQRGFRCILWQALQQGQSFSSSRISALMLRGCCSDANFGSSS